MERSWRQERCARTLSDAMIYADSREILEPPEYLESGESPVEWEEIEEEVWFAEKFSKLGETLKNPWLPEFSVKGILFSYRLLQEAYRAWRHLPLQRGRRVFFSEDSLSYIFVVLNKEERLYQDVGEVAAG